VRLFLDTNVLAAAIGTRGLCADLVAEVFEEHEIVVCEALLAELERVLIGKFRLPPALAHSYHGLLLDRGIMSEPVEPTSFASPDPDDTPLLAAAQVGGAEYFVTGDRALQAISPLGEMPIVSPRQMWEIIRPVEPSDR
jgi:putative PIN family toxin of toxin-antitoxin system